MDLVRGAGSAVTSRRHRLPAGLDRALDRAKWARRPGAADPPAAPPLVSPRTGAPARVLIGPANFAGQGRAWALALESAGVPAVSWAFTADATFGFGADHVAPLGAVHRASRAYQRAAFAAVVGAVEAVVIEAGRPLFGRLHGYDPVREAAALADAGVRVALLWHGTDVRVPSRHAATHARSPFADADHARRTRQLESVALRNRRRLARFDGPVLVSTPDLLEDLPGAQWCPVVVEPGRWAVAEPALRRAVPVVVHVPSNPWLKGSALVEPSVRSAEADGVVAYRAASGLPADGVRELYRDADVVLDQFRLGIYGVAACEAMAAGRLVVSDVDAGVRAAVRARTGLDLPVRQAAAEQVGDVLRDAAGAGRADASALARSGPGFVADVHDGRRSAHVLREALGL